MSYRIPNSNQFSAGEGGSSYTPSDFNFSVAGANLPTTQEVNIESSQPIRITLFLRRNQHETGKPSEDFIPAEEIVNLSYRKLVRYISSMDQEKLIAWYGASDQDIEAVESYVRKFGGVDISVNKEQRRASFTVTYSQFKDAFLTDRPEIVTNASDGTLFYYSPTDYSASYLTASGEGSQEFASAVIGIINEIDPAGNEQETDADKTRPKRPDGSQFSYYPSEIAKLYDFPSHNTTGAGRGVTIGLIGSGGNKFQRLNRGDTFKRYLQAQNIDTRYLGRLSSPNDSGAEDDWTESAMDYSILRSVAPRADIIVSTNDDSTFQDYAELIYNPDVDIISSSNGEAAVPGRINNGAALQEMFVDAILRGKSFVNSSGDAGTGNYSWGNLLPNGSPNADYSTGSSAVLSVGGTAFLGSQGQSNVHEESRGAKPYEMPQQLPKTTLDKITGLIGDQLTWNEYQFVPIKEIESGTEIYPDLANQFKIEDFQDATIVYGVFENVAGSSGVFQQAVQAMPRYQRKNLENHWQGTGRRYPDVSVLAGENFKNGFKSYYYVLNLENGKPVLTTGGGTSAGAPLIAGLLANITSGLRKKFGRHAKAAFVNPYLYQQYRTSKREELFIDVPKGSNNASTYSVASSPGEWPGKYVTSLVVDGTYYLLPLNGTGPGGSLDLNLSSTGKGFDAASGLGSINGQALFDGLSQVWSTI